MANSMRIKPNAMLGPLFLLEQGQLLRYAQFAILCEKATLPEEILSEQLTILFDLKEECDKRIPQKTPQADKEEIQRILNSFVPML